MNYAGELRARARDGPTGRDPLKDPEGPMETTSPDDDAAVERILRRSRRIAAVGASRDAAKDAGRIPLELRDRGFVVIPVTPNADELWGERAYPSLLEVRGPVDVVDVFRPAEEAPEIARQAVAIGAAALWLQLEIVSDEARAIAAEAGLDFVQDRCMGRESRRLDIRKADQAGA